MWPRQFDNIEIGLALVDSEGKFTKVNPYFCEMLGFSEDALIGRKFISITHPDDITDADKELEKTIARAPKAYSFVKRYIDKHGSSVWTRIIMELVDDKNMVFFKQIIPIKNGAREQLRKVDDTVQVVEQVNIGHFIYKNLWKIVQIVCICLATILGYLFTVGTKMFADSGRLDRIEKILEEKMK